jgi:hypothetical protein
VQRGCSIVFDDGPSSRSVLPQQHMKLQTRSWDGASRHVAFRATQKEVSVPYCQAPYGEALRACTSCLGSEQQQLGHGSVSRGYCSNCWFIATSLFNQSRRA